MKPPKAWEIKVGDRLVRSAFGNDPKVWVQVVKVDHNFVWTNLHDVLPGRAHCGLHYISDWDLYAREEKESTAEWIGRIGRELRREEGVEDMAKRNELFDVRVVEVDEEKGAIGVLHEERNLLAPTQAQAEQTALIRAVAAGKVTEGQNVAFASIRLVM